MADQCQRLFFFLKKFYSGRKYTSKDLYDMIPSEFGQVSLRTIQRDLLVLQEMEPALESERKGREIYYYISRDYRSHTMPFNVSASQLLSFYILKAHLKTFEGTMIEEELKSLKSLLERIAPADVFSLENLFWDKNIGNYNYFHHDSILRRVIDAISKKKWVEVSYNTSNKGIINKFVCSLVKLFAYAGSIYTIAYVPHHDSHIALALQMIEEVNELKQDFGSTPPFDFTEWSINRFGVFFGRPENVLIRIKAEYSHYFLNRFWHQSQQFTFESNGDLLLKLRVPLATDFISWILSWGDVMTVIKPVELIKEINLKLNNTLKNYE
ncbi:MAG: WYL domain-containing protein [Candidatus Kapabacteria bacterium]|nr:WYL domain-containing protein [Candidatus Kapabacteria bacterium]